MESNSCLLVPALADFGPSLLSLVPRPPHSFCCLQYKERGRPGISYHVNDVEGRETLIECGQNASNVPTQSWSRSSTRLLSAREQSHFWESLQRVSVEKR